MPQPPCGFQIVALRLGFKRAPRNAENPSRLRQQRTPELAQIRDRVMHEQEAALAPVRPAAYLPPCVSPWSTATPSDIIGNKRLALLPLQLRLAGKAKMEFSNQPGRPVHRVTVQFKAIFSRSPIARTVTQPSTRRRLTGCLQGVTWPVRRQ